MLKKILSILILLSLIGFCIINLQAPIRIQGDGVFYYSFLRSVIWDGDLDFRNELEHYRSYDVGSNWFLENNKLTPIGKIPNPYAYGSAIMWLPLVVIAHLTGLILRLFNIYVALDGYSYYYVLAVNFSTWLMGTLVLVINYSLVRQFFREKIAFQSILLMWLATPWIYYQMLEPSMSHMASLFMVTVFWYLVVKEWQGRAINHWLLSLVIFLMIAIRWQNVLFLIVYLPLFWSDLIQFKLRYLVEKTKPIVIPVVIFAVTQFLVWKHIYGQYVLIPQGKRFVRFEFHGLYTLFSSNHGLLLWSPILILALIGLFFLFKKNSYLARATFLAFFIQWIINSSLNDLGGGDAFGGRRFIETFPWLILALAMILVKLKQHPKIIWSVMILSIFWNLVLLENYRLETIPHAGEYDFFEVNYLQVIERDINSFIIN